MSEQDLKPKRLGSAIEIATEKIKSLDAEKRARDIGVEWDGEAFLFRYFGRPVRVVQATGECTVDGRSAPGFDTVLIMHYLTGATPNDLDHCWISFRELPDGMPYLAAFLERAPGVIAKTFDGDPDWFSQALQNLGATRDPALPGLAFTLSAFPRLPLAVIFHEGEPGLPADATILFDSSAPLHFCAEDLAVLGERLANRLAHSA